MEIRQAVSTDEQNRLVDDWYSRRPIKPTKARRVYMKRNRHMHEDGAWSEYERAMSAWRLEVRIFFKWWPANDYVSKVLRKSAKDTHVL